MMTGSVGIAAAVDLRSRLSVVRDQGDRSTCLACATSDAHAMLHKCAPLSAEFLFFHAVQVAKIGNVADGITFDEAAAALALEGQPSEAEWPYSMTQPDPWTPPAVTRIWRGILDHRAENASAEIQQLVYLGQPVVLGIKISAAFLSPAPPHFSIHAGGDGFGGHAVLVVGMGNDPSGQRFYLIQNSWGASWADNGYAWLSAEYMRDKVIGYAPVVPQK